MKQLSKKGLIFFIIGVMLFIVFRNSIGIIAGLGFVIAGIILVIKNRIDLNKKTGE